MDPYDWEKFTNMTVFTMSVQIMSRLKSIRTPPTGLLGAHGVVPIRFFTHCKKICSFTRPQKFTHVQFMNIYYTALFSHCKSVKITKRLFPIGLIPIV